MGELSTLRGYMYSHLRTELELAHRVERFPQGLDHLIRIEKAADATGAAFYAFAIESCFRLRAAGPD